MKKKVNLKIIAFGFMALQYSFIAKAQNATKDLAVNNPKNQNIMSTTNKFEFNPLPYGYEGLEPFIDKQTVEIHYSKHHKAYYEKFLNAIKDSEMESMDITDIFKNISKYPAAVRNNGGGYYNHTFYWEGMKPNGGILPNGKLSEAITKTFGSVEEFKKQFSEAGKTRFGSGWAWLSIDNKGNMFINSSPNQDNPLMDISEKKGIPLLTMDVWEHAYYLKYQNKRADYVDAFWNVVNWEEVTRRYETALKAEGLK